MTEDVKIDQSEGISGSGIPEEAFVKNVYRRSFFRSPNPPRLFFAPRSLRIAPLTERLEQAKTLSAHSVRPRKMPGCIVPVREIFCK